MKRKKTNNNNKKKSEENETGNRGVKKNAKGEKNNEE